MRRRDLQIHVYVCAQHVVSMTSSIVKMVVDTWTRSSAIAAPDREDKNPRHRRRKASLHSFETHREESRTLSEKQTNKARQAVCSSFTNSPTIVILYTPHNPSGVSPSEMPTKKQAQDLDINPAPRITEHTTSLVLRAMLLSLKYKSNAERPIQRIPKQKISRYFQVEISATKTQHLRALAGYSTALHDNSLSLSTQLIAAHTCVNS